MFSIKSGSQPVFLNSMNIIIFPVEISNKFGSQKYKINIPFYEITDIAAISKLESLKIDLLGLVESSKVVDHVRPLLIVNIDKRVESSIMSSIKLKRFFPTGALGFCIDLTSWLVEAPYRLSLLGEMTPSFLPPQICLSSCDNYPMFPYPN